ncbi:MAG: PEP-CTERM sorting domain-containing protein [Opitutaceae bacterium]|nr:PEP-CTERM sorting domain-containing protein [Opitutaceae bacterium]
MKTYHPIQSRRRRHSMLTLLLLAGFSTTPAPAQTVVEVTTSTAAPAENILAAYTLADGANADKTISGWAWRNTTTDGLRDLGQRFVAPANALIDKITVLTLNTSGAGTQAADFTLTLYSFTATTSAGVVDRTLLQASGTMPAASIATNTWLTLNLPGSVALEQGVSYGFILHFNEAADDRSITLQQAENAAVTGYYRIQSTDGSTTFGTANTSLIFYVGTAAIPEPSTSLLFPALGAAAYALTRRRRHRHRPDRS